MEKRALKHHIPKEKEGTYYRLPLKVPAGMEEMTIRYSYDRGGNNCVDLGLCDEKGDFLGWSGSARQEIQIGPYFSTPGYRLTELREGTWYILVGAYHIPEEGLEVRYEITYRAPAPGGSRATCICTPPPPTVSTSPSPWPSGPKSWAWTSSPWRTTTTTARTSICRCSRD